MTHNDALATSLVGLNLRRAHQHPLTTLYGLCVLLLSVPGIHISSSCLAPGGSSMPWPVLCWWHAGGVGHLASGSQPTCKHHLNSFICSPMAQPWPCRSPRHCMPRAIQAMQMLGPSTRLLDWRPPIYSASICQTMPVQYAPI